VPAELGPSPPEIKRRSDRIRTYVVMNWEVKLLNYDPVPLKVSFQRCLAGLPLY
jgi:hypothetical protein